MAGLADDLRGMVQRGQSEGLWRGAVVAWGDGFGMRGHVAEGESGRQGGGARLTLESRFDLASLTKPLAVGVGLAYCRQLGLLELDTPVARWASVARPRWPSSLTVRHLASHCSGFDNGKPALSLRGRTMLDAWLDREAVTEPGAHFEYACLNAVILGMVVEVCLGWTLGEVVAEMLEHPLGLKGLRFGPVRDDAEVVPTSNVAAGEINDSWARAIGVPVGNAGLFGTAYELATVAVALLRSYHGSETTLRLSGESVRWMVGAIRGVEGAERGVLWDRRTSGSSTSRPPSAGANSFGHSGWTGQSLWIDPDRERFAIAMTNRTLMAGMERDPAGHLEASNRARGELLDRVMREPVGAECGSRTYGCTNGHFEREVC